MKKRRRSNVNEKFREVSDSVWISFEAVIIEKTIKEKWIDKNYSNKLTRPEFYEACAHFGLQLSTKDLDDFFYLYSTPQNTITITAFAKDMYNGAFENKINPPTDASL